MNRMKALKLIWLSDRFHLRQYGRPITQDYYIAMENGPVASATRDILQKNAMGVDRDTITYSEEFLLPIGKYEYKSIAEPDFKVFSKTDLEALSAVFESYGRMEKYDLRDLTHEFPEWKKWEDAIKDGQTKSCPMEYGDFFLDSENRQPLFDDDKETLELTKNIFLRK